MTLRYRLVITRTAASLPSSDSDGASARLLITDGDGQLPTESESRGSERAQLPNRQMIIYFSVETPVASSLFLVRPSRGHAP